MTYTYFDVKVLDDGIVSIETVSILEDLLHDYEYYLLKSQQLAAEKNPENKLLIKRYQRAAFLFMMSYFEGVVNCWIRESVNRKKWNKLSRLSSVKKIEELMLLLSLDSVGPIEETIRSLRNNLVHFNKGKDKVLYKGITNDIILSTQDDINNWFKFIESKTGKKRHPITEDISKNYFNSLGKTISEVNSKDFT